MCSFWLRPSATYMYFCCGSFENATSQVEPSASDSGSTKISFTNLPSRVNTCSRSLVRSHTYTRPSTDTSAQCTGPRNCCDGVDPGVYLGAAAAAASSGLLPYAPQYRLNLPVSMSRTTTRLLP